MVRRFLSHSTGTLDAAGVMRIGEHIDVGKRRFAVDGVERRAGLGAEFPALLAEERGTLPRPRSRSSSFLSLRKISVRCAHGQASET